MCLAQPGITKAQAGNAQPDTLRLTLKETEKVFFEKNLQLLAAHYNVQADSALIQQAKLWDNPVLNTDQNIYSNNAWFEHGKNPDGTPKGQYYIQVQQLIQTAGKRGKQIKLAATNATITQWQFNDLMRNLKMQLRSDFYTVYQLENNRALYQQEQEQTNTLLKAMSSQLSAGNIARKDYLRIQALQIGLQQDATDNEKQLSDVQAELKTMLQITGDTYVKPVMENISIPSMPSQNLEDLVSTARQNNAAYQLQKLQVQFQQQNLALQKALAVPDVTLGPNYDQNSNYTPHYVGLGISLPLPVFNRNQGNIKSARYQIKQEETNMQMVDQQLQNDVMNAWKKLQYTLQLSTNSQQAFYDDYGKLYTNIVESYKQRQISLIEFTDYFEAYKDIRQKQIQQELNVQLAKEELNRQVGTDVIQ
ncbi:TolC family protein [Taibaiella soli]|nr:TolC family protein [Taibaiella soli]